MPCYSLQPCLEKLLQAQTQNQSLPSDTVVAVCMREENFGLPAF